MRAPLTIVLSLMLLMAFTDRLRGQTVPVPSPLTQVAKIAQMREVHSAFQWFQSHEPELRKWQLEMVAIAAPPHGEAKRAQWVAQRFTDLGLQHVEVDAEGNVLGVLPGSDPGARYAVLSAHIDTVFPPETQLNIRAESDKLFGPGISDNGAGVIGMLAVLAALKESPVRHTAPILFVGNVGEEGEGDLRGMRYLFTQSKWKDELGSTLVLDGAGADSVVTEALGSRRFEITFRGPGGHSWSDFGIVNPIIVLSRAVAKISEAHVPTEPKTALNVGVIAGGTSVNSIPEAASAKVDIRSADPAEIDRLEKILREAVANAVRESQAEKSVKSAGLSADVKVIGNRPAADLPAKSRIFEVIQAVDRHLNLRTTTRRASTDANIPLSLGKEAISIGAGGSGGGAHTVHEWYDPAGRDLGLKRIYLTMLTLAGVE